MKKIKTTLQEHSCMYK